MKGGKSSIELINIIDSMTSSETIRNISLSNRFAINQIAKLMGNVRFYSQSSPIATIINSANGMHCVIEK